jgi:hypothetical protein
MSRLIPKTYPDGPRPFVKRNRFESHLCSPSVSLLVKQNTLLGVRDVPFGIDMYPIETGR